MVPSDKEQATDALRKIRATLVSIELDFNAENVVDAILVHDLAEEMSTLMYLCGLKNGRIIGGE